MPWIKTSNYTLLSIMAADHISLNRYVYCGNDRVNYVDPMGTFKVTVSINGGGSPKSTVPEPPKPQTPTSTYPTPQTAPTSGTKQSSSSTVISQTVKTSQPTESAPQAPAQPTVIQNLIKGTYFGTQYGEENTDWYVQRIVEKEHGAAWYELVPYYVGAGFSVLWTPDTWWMTAGTLIGGLAIAKVAAGATLAKVARGIKTAFATISGWLGLGETATTYANKLHHIFGQAKHNLGSLVDSFGGNLIKAYNAIYQATQTYIISNNVTGIFEIRIVVNNFEIIVRGNVIEGIVKIGTVFIEK